MKQGLTAEHTGTPCSTANPFPPPPKMMQRLHCQVAAFCFKQDEFSDLKAPPSKTEAEKPRDKKKPSSFIKRMSMVAPEI